MRAADAREIYACRWREDPDDVARDAIAIASVGFCAWTPAGVPAAVVAGAELWPGFWQVAMFATEDWDCVAASTTRAIMSAMIPAMLVAGGRRAECRSHVDHEAAHRWLARLGFVAEAKLWDMGKAGEDFILFVWRRDVVHVQ